ncbi:anionic trypsin-like [Aphidius gifuensis]|uniref:anionic trypsin-like n=1 Tax=Aphidius gifuensis TaxID=684658 RepID=UPI001CDBBF1A|nr:anionic trypsin-like [Aphidius gifuensis]
MNFIILIVNLIILYITAVNAGPSKIEGGALCRIQDKPSVVSIQRNSYHICGGAILSEKLVITSASCLMLDNLVIFGNLEVFSGTADLLEQGSSQVNRVQLVILHPQYDPKNFWINDIAILRLSKPMLLNWNRREVWLSSRNKNLNRPIVISGWGGSLETSYEPSRYLKKIEVHELSSQSCLALYGKYGGVHENQRCATSMDPTKEHVTMVFLIQVYLFYNL